MDVFALRTRISGDYSAYVNSFISISDPRIREIVQRKDVAAYGEYRTQRVILEVNDAMVEAERTGQPYRTRLDPPPANPRVAHG